MQIPRSLQGVSDGMTTVRGKGLSIVIAGLMAGILVRDVAFPKEAHANQVTATEIGLGAAATASILANQQAINMVNNFSRQHNLDGNKVVKRVKATFEGNKILYSLILSWGTITNVYDNPIPAIPIDPRHENPNDVANNPWNTGNWNGQGNPGNYQGGVQQAPQMENRRERPVEYPAVGGDIIMNKELEDIENRAENYNITIDQQLGKTIYYLVNPRNNHELAFIIIDENGKVDNMRVSAEKRKGLGSVLVHKLNTNYGIIPTVTRGSILDGAHQFWNMLKDYQKINLIEDRE